MIQKCLNMEIPLPPSLGVTVCVGPEFSLLFCLFADTPVKYVLSCILPIKCVFIALQVVVPFFGINLEALPLMFEKRLARSWAPVASKLTHSFFQYLPSTCYVLELHTSFY